MIVSPDKFTYQVVGGYKGAVCGQEGFLIYENCKKEVRQKIIPSRQLGRV